MATNATNQRKSRSANSLVTKGFKPKSRNWKAGVVASAIAVAWAIGGLVMPSMAATPTTMASVKPTVEVDSDGIEVHGGSGDTTRYAIALKTDLYYTMKQSEAAKHYGETKQVGEYTAQYLPKACIVSPTGWNNMEKTDKWSDGFLDVTMSDRGREGKTVKRSIFGTWVLYPNSVSTASFSRAASAPASSGSNTVTFSINPISLGVDSGSSQAKVLRASTDPNSDPNNASTPSSQPGTQPAPAQGTAPVNQQRTIVVPLGTKTIVFKPASEFKFELDMNADKATNLARFNQEYDQYVSDVLRQFDDFAAANNLTAAQKAKMRAALDAQLAKSRQDLEKAIGKRYDELASAKFPGLESCEKNGPIVPVGTLVLAKNWRATEKFHNDDVWNVGKKSSATRIDSVTLYQNSAGATITTGKNNVPSFCVEPFSGLQVGKHNAYVNAHKSTIEWAQKNPEKGETIKAIAWHYFQHGQVGYGRHQNAIWVTILGLPDTLGTWDSEKGTWGDSLSSLSALIKEAKAEYKNRVSVLKALETMHLDQTDLKEDANGNQLLSVQLRDYDTNKVIRDTLRGKVYIKVNNATYADGTEIKDGIISLEDAEKGVTLKITDQKNFSIGFEGGVDEVKDAYFLDKPLGDTQGQVTVTGQKLTVSGNLKVTWPSKPKPEPTIGTSASVSNDANEWIPAAAPEELTKPRANTFYMLHDSATINKVDDKKTYKIQAELKRIRTDKVTGQQKTDTVFTFDPEYLSNTYNKMGAKYVTPHRIKNGSAELTNFIWYKLMRDDMQVGDHFYFTEKLYELEGVDSYNRAIWSKEPVAVHDAPSNDQSVKIKDEEKKFFRVYKTGKSITDKGLEPGFENEKVNIDVECGVKNGGSFVKDKYYSYTKLWAPANGNKTEAKAYDGYTYPIEIPYVANFKCQVKETLNLKGDYPNLYLDWSTVNATWSDGDGTTYSPRIIGNYEGYEINFPEKCLYCVNDDVSLHITNNYYFDTGNIYIGKRIETGDVSLKDAFAANGGHFDFALKCGENYKRDFQINSDGTFDWWEPSEPATKHHATMVEFQDTNTKKFEKYAYFTDAPLKVDCQVQEKTPLTPGGYDGVLKWERMKPWRAPEVAQYNEWVSLGQLNKENDCATRFTATNSYVDSNAKFSVHKVARYIGGDEIKDKTFNFEYECTNGKTTITGKIPGVKSGEAAKPVEDSRLKAGMTCKVWEVSPAAVAGATHIKTGYKVSDAEELSNSPTDGITFKLPRKKDASVVVDVTNEYKKDMGRFKVLKDDASNIDVLKNKVFTFKAKCDDGTPEEQFTVTQLGEKGAQLSKQHKAGAKCTIWEEKVDGEGNLVTNEDMTWSGDGKVVDVPEASNGKGVEITIVKDQTLSAQVKNDVKALTGKLTITKKLEGTASKNSQVPSEFSFDVKCGDAFNDADFKVPANDTKTIENIPVGTKCTVKENRPAAISGIKIDTTWDDGTNTAATNAKSLTINQKDQVIAFKATNKYDYKMVKFDIAKIIDVDVIYGSEAKFNPEDTFDFTYNCTFTGKAPATGTVKVKPNGDAVSVDENGKALEVPQGSHCTVTETKLPQIKGVTYNLEYTGTQMSVNGKLAAQKGKTVEFDATGTDTINVKAENSYRKQVTGFDVKKRLDGNTAGLYKEKLFPVNYVCTKGTDANGKDKIVASNVNDSAQDKAIGGLDGKKLERSGLPAGAVCTFWEETDQPTGFQELTLTWDSNGKGTDVDYTYNGSTYKAHRVTLEKDTPVSVVLTNKYDTPYAKLTLTKKVTEKGDYVNVANKVFNFDVTCKYSTENGGEHVIKDWTDGSPKAITLKGGKSVTLEKDASGNMIPAGSLCTITEKDASVANHTWSLYIDGKKEDVHNNPTTTVKADSAKTVEVTFDNQYERDKGKFLITKKLESAASLEHDNAYEFEYVCTGDAGNKTGNGQLERKGGKWIGPGESWTINNVPLGYTCKVAESAPQVANAELTFSMERTDGHSTDDVTTEVKDGKTWYKFVVNKDNPSFEFTATNKYSKENGHFSVTKKEEMDNQYVTGLPQGITYHFSYTCTDRDGNVTAPKEFQLKKNQTFSTLSDKVNADNGTPTWVDRKGNATTHSPIAAGSKCTVTELGATVRDVNGKNVDVSALTGANFTPAWQINPSNTTVGTGTSGSNSPEVEIQYNQNTKMTVTNTWGKDKTKILLKKVAEAEGQNDPNAFITGGVVKFDVECGNTFHKTVEVKSNDPTGVTLDGVPVGSQCTVKELNVNFKDTEAFEKYGLSHGVSWVVKNAMGHTVEPSAAPVGIEKAKTAKFDIPKLDLNQPDVPLIEVTMTNQWNKKWNVNTVLGDNHPAGQVLTVNTPNNDKATVELKDQVTLQGLPDGNYSVVGALFDAAQQGKIDSVAKFNANALDVTGDGIADTFNTTEPVTVENGKGTATVTYKFNAGVFKKHPNGVAAGVLIYRNGKLVAHEYTLPADQMVKPDWSPVIGTQATTQKTKNQVLPVGKNLDDIKISDTVNYTSLQPGSYDVYGRVVAVGDENRMIGEGTVPGTMGSPQANGLVSGKWTNTLTITAAQLQAAIDAKVSEFVVYEFVVPAGTNARAMSVADLKAQSTYNGKTYYHANPSDLAQKLFTPSLHTTAALDKPVTQETTGKVKVTDKVYWTNLIADKTYKLTGTLHVKKDDGTDGGVLPDPGATKIVPDYKVPIPKGGKAGDIVKSGSTDMTFEINASSLKSKTAVVFEELHEGNILVAIHASIDDDAQTVTSAKVATKVTAPAGKAAGRTIAMGTNQSVKVDLTDTVEYWSLQKDKRYVLSGKVMAVANGQAQGIVAETESEPFSPATNAEAVHGTHDLTFKNVEVTRGHTYVVFEELYLLDKDGKKGDKPIAVHKDAKDLDQTVFTPHIDTTASDNADGDKILDATQGTVEVKDIVDFSGLNVGKDYTLEGELQFKNGGGAVPNTKQSVKLTIDQDGKVSTDPAVKVTKQNTDGRTTSGTVELIFKVAKADLVKGPIVAFEDIRYENISVVAHHDLNDTDQTVYPANLRTDVSGSADGSLKVVKKQHDQGATTLTVTDNVTLNGNLKPRTSYTLEGELHRVTVAADGTKSDAGVVTSATSEKVTVETGDTGRPTKDIKMVFKVPASVLTAGSTFVVFETLKDQSGKTVLTHRDVNDLEQTIEVQDSTVTTDAYGDKDLKDKNLSTSEKETTEVYDLVTFKGLNPKNTYTLKGELYYKGSGVLKDKTEVSKGMQLDPKYIKSTELIDTADAKADGMNFTPNKANGTVLMKFTVLRSGLTTAPMVAFEYVKDGDIEIASHTDINDGKQTVYHPDVTTTATVPGVTKGTTAKIVQATKNPKPVTVTDSVKWSNLAPGTYTLKGELMQVTAGKVSKVADGDSKTIENTGANFKPNGTETMEFTLPADKIVKDAKFVVYEYIYNQDGTLVAKHADKDDPDQTIEVGTLNTTATDNADGDHVADNNGKDAVIVDKVTYSGLKLDEKYADGTLKAYLVTGQLMQKPTKPGEKPKPVPGVAPQTKVIGAAGSEYRDGNVMRAVEEVITSGTGELNISFTVPKKAYGEDGIVTVAFETIQKEGVDYLIHHDIDAPGQTVYLPGVKTVASVDGAAQSKCQLSKDLLKDPEITKSKCFLVNEKQVVSDDVTLNGLMQGAEYYVVGTLMNKATGKAVEGVAPVTSEKFTADTPNLVKEGLIKFNVPKGAVKNGDTLVVYEQLFMSKDAKGNVVTDKTPEASHENIDSKAQAVFTDETDQIVHTILHNNDGAQVNEDGSLTKDAGSRTLNDPTPVVKGSPSEFVDEVAYKGLNAGTWYRMRADLREVSLDGKTTNSVALGFQDFQPQSADGTVGVKIDLSGVKLKTGYKYVAFETLMYKDTEEVLVKHHEKDDANQTVVKEVNTDLKTTLTSTANSEDKIISISKDATLRDVVTFTGTGLIPQAKYYLFSQLLYKPGTPDEKVVSAVLSKPFTATGENLKSKTVDFTIPAKVLQELQADPNGQYDLVAYEYLALASDVVKTNADAKTPAEAVSFKTGAKWAATHTKADDADQTVSVVGGEKIETDLVNDSNRKSVPADTKKGKTVIAGESVTVTDSVKYFNLKPETTYTLRAELMAVDANGNLLSSTPIGSKDNVKCTTIAAKSGQHRVSGECLVDVNLKWADLIWKDAYGNPVLDAEGNEQVWPGVVAFETLKLNGEIVAEHKNPNDGRQTVTPLKPSVGTDASNAKDSTRNIESWEGKNPAGKEAPGEYTITDEVQYQNLKVGKEYALQGYLYDKATYKPGVKPLAVAATTFTPKASEGKILRTDENAMKFKVSRDKLTDASQLVVFEYLWEPGTFTGVTAEKVTGKPGSKPVAEHAKVDAPSQTITVNKPTFGSLELNKQVTGWSDADAEPGVNRTDVNYLFDIKCDMTDSDGKVTWTKDYGRVSVTELKGHKITGIPNGAKCTVTEILDDPTVLAQTGREIKVTYDTGSLPKTIEGKGSISVVVGGTSNGTNVVPDVVVTAKNTLVPNPNIVTNTSSAFGKTATVNGSASDTVTYSHFRQGEYLVHSYLVEMVDKNGVTVPQKIADLMDGAKPYSEVDVSAKNSTADADGRYSGAWMINFKIPEVDALKNLDKQVVVWQDVYKRPAADKLASFRDSLANLKAGEFSKLGQKVAFHHETRDQLGDGYQYLSLKPNYGGFKLKKVVDDSTLNKAQQKRIPLKYTFTWKVTEMPAGYQVKPGTPNSGTIDLEVNSMDKFAESDVIEGFPIGTKIMITEADVKANQLPTGVTMKPTWSGKLFGNATGFRSATVVIGAEGESGVTATNTFTYTKPTIGTTAFVGDEKGNETGVQLKPAGAATYVYDTVKYTGLTKGYHYWLKSELVHVDSTTDYKDNAPVNGADGQPLVRWTRVTADETNGEWTVDKNDPMVVPGSINSTDDVVFFESLYENADNSDTHPADGVEPLATHRNGVGNNATNHQILTHQPTLDLRTTARMLPETEFKDDEGLAVEDTVYYSGLEGNQKYTLVGWLMNKRTGARLDDTVTALYETAPGKPLTSDPSGSGAWKMRISLTPDQLQTLITAGLLQDGDQLVVYQTIYLGTLPDVVEAPPATYKESLLFKHEDLNDGQQTVTLKLPVKPETTTPGTPGTPGTPVTPPRTPPMLAHTGAMAALIGTMALLLIGAGAAFGLVAAKRKRKSE